MAMALVDCSFKLSMQGPIFLLKNVLHSLQVMTGEMQELPLQLRMAAG